MRNWRSYQYGYGRTALREEMRQETVVSRLLIIIVLLKAAGAAQAWEFFPLRTTMVRQTEHGETNPRVGAS